MPMTGKVGFADETGHRFREVNRQSGATEKKKCLCCGNVNIKSQNCMSCGASLEDADVLPPL